MLDAFRASPAGVEALGGERAEERAAKEAQQVTRMHLGLPPSERLRVEGDEELVASRLGGGAVEGEEEEEVVTELRPRVDTWLEREGREDCETVVSTYSNLENRPKVLGGGEGRRRRRPVQPPPPDLPEAPIRLGKTGLPVDYLPHTRRTEAGEAAGEGDSSEGEQSEGEGGGEAARDWRADIRRKGETPEEKRARKAAVKEGRREARADKKATKTAFGQEMAATRPRNATGSLPRGASILPML